MDCTLRQFLRFWADGKSRTKRPDHPGRRVVLVRAGFQLRYQPRQLRNPFCNRATILRWAIKQNSWNFNPSNRKCRIRVIRRRLENHANGDSKHSVAFLTNLRRNEWPRIGRVGQLPSNKHLKPSTSHELDDPCRSETHPSGHKSFFTRFVACELEAECRTAF